MLYFHIYTARQLCPIKTHSLNKEKNSLIHEENYKNTKISFIHKTLAIIKIFGKKLSEY